MAHRRALLSLSRKALVGLAAVLVPASVVAAPPNPKVLKGWLAPETVPISPPQAGGQAVLPAFLLVRDAASPQAIAVYASAGGVIEVARRLDADATWKPAAPLPGDAISPRLASDGSGRATAVWISGERVWTSDRGSLTNAWTPPVALSETAAAARDPRVAMDGTGNAIVAWVRAGVVQAAYRPTGGAYGPVIDLAPAAANPGSGVLSDEAVAITTGVAVVAWVRDGAPQAARYVLPAGWEPRQTMPGHPPAGQSYGVHVALDGSGNATVAWREGCATLSATRSTAQAAWTQEIQGPYPQPCDESIAGSQDIALLVRDGGVAAAGVSLDTGPGPDGFAFATRATAGGPWSKVPVVLPDDARTFGLKSLASGPALVATGAGGFVTAMIRTASGAVEQGVLPAAKPTGEGSTVGLVDLVESGGDVLAAWETGGGTAKTVIRASLRPGQGLLLLKYKATNATTHRGQATKFAFTLSNPARVTFSILTADRKKTLRTFTVGRGAGAQLAGFSGVVKGRPLAPGTYRVRAVATSGSAVTTPTSITLKVVT